MSLSQFCLLASCPDGSTKVFKPFYVTGDCFDMTSVPVLTWDECQHHPFQAPPVSHKGNFSPWRSQGFEQGNNNGSHMNNSCCVWEEFL